MCLWPWTRKNSSTQIPIGVPPRHRPTTCCRRQSYVAVRAQDDISNNPGQQPALTKATAATTNPVLAHRRSKPVVPDRSRHLERVDVQPILRQCGAHTGNITRQPPQLVTVDRAALVTTGFGPPHPETSSVVPCQPSLSAGVDGERTPRRRWLAAACCFDCYGSLRGCHSYRFCSLSKRMSKLYG